jgi:hypothetical protein
VKRTLLAAALVIVMSLLVVSCLREIAAPTICPSPTGPLNLDCLNGEPIAQCPSDQKLACAAGRKTCVCGADDCPESGATCNPPPDCPAVVRERFPNARCLGIGRIEFADTEPPLEEEDAAPDAADAGPPPPIANCSCGCAECLRQCDGKGVVLALPPGIFSGRGLVVALPPEELPPSGRLRFYVRLRGSYTVSLSVLDPTVLSLDAEVEASSLPHDTLSAFLGDRYAEFMTFETQKLEWSSSSARPGILLVNGDPTIGTFADFDCIVPFVTPL